MLNVKLFFIQVDEGSEQLVSTVKMRADGEHDIFSHDILLSVF